MVTGQILELLSELWILIIRAVQRYKHIIADPGHQSLMSDIRETLKKSKIDSRMKGGSVILEEVD